MDILFLKCNNGENNNGKVVIFVLLSRDETSVEASMKIKEIIVVEGKDDTVAIKRAVDAIQLKRTVQQSVIMLLNKLN